MAMVNLATAYRPYTDEIFTTESKKSLITNNDFNWDGAHTVKVYSVTTARMNNYDRQGTSGEISRYGPIQGLDATTQEFTLRNDRSFTFAVDTLDMDETNAQLEGASALARQIREVVVPEIDTYTLGIMCRGAGTKPDPVALTKTNIYTEIIKANNELDNAQVPGMLRSLIVTPDVYLLMKQCKDIVMETDIGNDMRQQGVIGNLDGLNIVKVPKIWLPEDFGFMIVHPCACVAPTKLKEYFMHHNPPFINGTLVEGRFVYDAFVLENKAKAIYYQAQPAKTTPTDPTE